MILYDKGGWLIWQKVICMTRVFFWVRQKVFLSYKEGQISFFIISRVILSLLHRGTNKAQNNKSNPNLYTTLWKGFNLNLYVI